MNKRYKRRKKWRAFGYLKVMALFAVMAVVASWLEHQNREQLSAEFKVVDGDSLQNEDVRIRLVGIDAPEIGQICGSAKGDYRCGIEARDFLRKLIGDNRPDCYVEGKDKYGRFLAECFVGKTNLNAQLVASGWAVSYGSYGWQEQVARRGKRGLWSGQFDRPQDWRATHSGLADGPSGRIWHGLWRRISYWFSTVESNE
ncbi:thermonuclease family protein [Ahrensia marina]|uniref:thermonuclease family protein n=1 Tax=Ahrensia marina TaxID=1514904 RepID=UPI0011875F5E|nr:thermonuclease family protein [Ahrensia marina]